MLDLARLRTFREVASRGSFSSAAAALDYTQSAVSQQIATLERDLGLTLIERGNRPVGLTEAGRVLLRRTDAIFGEVATAEAELKALAGLEGGSVRLGGFASACATLLPQAITRFAERYPGVDVLLSEMEPPTALQMLRAAEVDLAVTYSFDGDVATADEGFDAVQLASDPFLIALPASHRLAGRRSLKLSELKNERWLGSPATGAAARYGEFVVRVCRQAGFEPRVAFEPGDLWTGRGIVAAGLAVGLMPRLAFSIPHPGVVTKPLSGATPARRILAVRVGDRRVAGVPPMLECLREAFGAWRAPG